MTERLPNAYIVPFTIIMGIALQKSTSVAFFLVKFREKRNVKYYYLNGVAFVFNLLAIISMIAQMDWANSPYNVSVLYFFQTNLAFSIGNNVAALPLLYLLLARLQIFYTVLLY